MAPRNRDARRRRQAGEQVPRDRTIPKKKREAYQTQNAADLACVHPGECDFPECICPKKANAGFYSKRAAPNETPALGIGKRIRKGVFEFRLGKVGDGLAQQTLHVDIGSDDGDYCLIMRPEAQRGAIELTSIRDGGIVLKVKRR